VLASVRRLSVQYNQFKILFCTTNQLKILFVQPLYMTLMHMSTEAKPMDMCSSQSVLGKPTMIFVCFCACLTVLLTNDKLYFRTNCFWLFVDQAP